MWIATLNISVQNSPSIMGTRALKHSVLYTLERETIIIFNTFALHILGKCQQTPEYVKL